MKLGIPVSLVVENYDENVVRAVEEQVDNEWEIQSEAIEPVEERKLYAVTPSKATTYRVEEIPDNPLDFKDY